MNQAQANFSKWLQYNDPVLFQAAIIRHRSGSKRGSLGAVPYAPQPDIFSMVGSAPTESSWWGSLTETVSNFGSKLLPVLTEVAPVLIKGTTQNYMVKKGYTEQQLKQKMALAEQNRTFTPPPNYQPSVPPQVPETVKREIARKVGTTSPAMEAMKTYLPLAIAAGLGMVLLKKKRG